VGQGIGNGRVRTGVADEPKRQHGDRRSRRPIIGRGGWQRDELGALRGLRVRNEPEPLPMDRSDVALGLAVVSQGLPRRLDAAGDGGLGHDASIPNPFEDLGLPDEPLAVFDEQGEQREDLRLDRTNDTAGAQLDGVRIQLEGVEPVDHRRQDNQPPWNLHETFKLGGGAACKPLCVDAEWFRCRQSTTKGDTPCRS
jgi:hypothetical protein